ncbi:MAG: YciI family protein, partial [Actinomycetales bacterium]
MKYMLLIHGNAETDRAIENEAREDFVAGHSWAQEELRASGELLDSNELSPEEAKIVRTTAQGLSVTDGAFTEGRETNAGYYIVDCADMDRAVEIAGRFAEARYTPIEVRRLVH